MIEGLELYNYDESLVMYLINELARSEKTETAKDILDKAIEAGADDVIEEENGFQVLTSVEDFNDVRDTLEEQGVPFIEASLSMIPKNTIDVSQENIASSLLKLLENLEDHDDVQNVHANFEIEENLMEKLS